MAKAVLDRLVPPDWEHVRKYALAELPEPVVDVPVILGVNWYSDFDYPVSIGSGREAHWFVARGGIKGTIRGGHCITTKPGHLKDYTYWWRYYNQGEEGACVSFGSNRCMTLLNRREYDPWKFYEQIKLPGGGAYVRSALELLVSQGPWLKSGRAFQKDGIREFRWAQSVDEIHQVLNNPVANRLGAIPILNSWGTDYPHVVYIPDDVVDRLLREDGEAAVVTDR